LYEKKGRQPTEEEVSCAMHLTPRKRGLIKNAIHIRNAVPQGAQQDNSDSFDDLVTKARSGTPDSGPERSAELQDVLQLVDKLDHRARIVLRQRFGLGGQQTRTLREIGESLDLTRERVRQIEREALIQLNGMLVAE